MFIFGFPGDALKYIQSFWLWDRGELAPIFPNQIFFINFVGFFTKSFGETLGFDLALAAVLVLSFSVIYYTSLRMMGRAPALLASVIYCSSAYFFWHGTQNLELILGAGFLPLLIVSALNLEKAIRGSGPLLKNSLTAGLALSLIVLSSFYLGYLSVVAFCGLFIFFRLTDSPLKISVFLNRRMLAGYLIVVLTTAVLTVSVYLPLLEYYFGRLSPETSRAISAVTTRSTVSDVVAFSARPWDYFMPSIYHPVFGSPVQGFYRYVREHYSYQFWSTFLPERANYLTFTGIGLALYALWAAFRSWWHRTHAVSPDDSRNIGLLVLMAIFMFLVSMPAVIEIKGFPLYFPSYFLFKVFPMFRVYARAGVFVLLAVSLLAGYGLKFLRAKIDKKKSVVLTAVLCGAVLFENLNFPPFAVMDVGHVPQVYAWLKNQPGDLVIAEYPRDNSVVDIGGGCPNWLDPKITRDYNWAYTVFYQMVHGKENLNMEKLSKEERVALGDLGSVGSYKVLKKYGVNYVLAHTKDPMIGIHPFPYPQENPLDECWQRRIMKVPDKVYEKFMKVAEFDDGIVYQLQ